MKASHVDGDPIDRSRFPVDPWRFVECDPDLGDLGVTETLFTVANGYIGMRGNPEEGRDAHEHGTFINGFHETWPIRHAETAFGFARTGQTIVNVPDAKLMKLYVDDEPLVIGTADLEHYERSLDFRDGVLRRSLVWRTPSGKRVRVESTRMVSMTQRHLAVLTLEVTMLSGDAPVIVSSQLLNRQDGKDEYHEPAQSKVAAADPRKAGVFEGRVLEPKLHLAHEDRMMLGYRAANSGMTVAVAADHTLSTDDPYEVILRDDPDLTKMVFRVDAREGRPVRVEKTVAYHTSRSLPVRELADRCDRTLDRAARFDLAHYRREQREWYDRFWAASDVEVASDEPGHDGIQQAIRYNLFTLAQASGRADGQGVPAKGVTGSGYEGHYFWDSEVYVAPFLTYTSPEVARNLMHFRSMMLPAARDRARELSQRGALFPWRTINGEEASAYYAAGTAQVHIDADVVHALVQYVNATRRRRVPPARRPADPRRDRAALRRPRVLAQQRRALLPHPRRHRARRVHDGRQQQPLHERHGPLQPRAGGDVGRVGPARPPRGVRSARRQARARRRRDRRVGRLRRRDAHPVRRRSRHPPAGRLLPRP